MGLLKTSRMVMSVYVLNKGEWFYVLEDTVSKKFANPCYVVWYIKHSSMSNQTWTTICFLFFVSLAIGLQAADDEDISPELWQEACWIVIR